MGPHFVAVVLEAHSWAFAPRQRGLDPPFYVGLRERLSPYYAFFPLRPAFSGTQGKEKKQKETWGHCEPGEKPPAYTRLRREKAAESRLKTTPSQTPCH